jgi:ATP-dependent DNA helicase RecQ
LNKALDILSEKWGHNSFRKPQEEIINAVLNKKDCIALLPTGGGKSVCYQIPTLLQEGICLVISPLLALMQDQVDGLTNKKIKAVALNTALNQDELIVLFDNIQFNNIKFLYLSPEKLQSRFIQEKIKQLNISIIAIDEAHCISEWGHDFRPSYLQLDILKEICPEATTIALTATANKLALKDISDHLNIDAENIFKTSFERKNLAYQVFEVEDKFSMVLKILNKIKAPAIIYSNTRRDTKIISEQLNKNGFSSTYYHGGLSSKEKSNAFNSWNSEETPIIVATNAFGMGIDKANIRVVIHYKLPFSVENYIQEAGRGGRDGNKSFCVTLTNNADITEYRSVIEKNKISIDFIKKVYLQLNQNFHIIKGELSTKIHPFNINEFCSKYKFPVYKTYAAIKSLNLHEVLVLNESIQKKNYLLFTASSDYVLDYCDSNTKHGSIIKTILRSYGGMFENFTPINLYSISKKTNQSKKQLEESLALFEKDGILKYIPNMQHATLQFLKPREDNRTINSISKDIEKLFNHKERKAFELLDFIQNNKTCRSLQLLEYFDEKGTKECGMCEVCVAKKTVNIEVTKIEELVLAELSKIKELTSKEICERINSNETNILRTLQILLEENKISITKGNKFTLVSKQ